MEYRRAHWDETPDRAPDRAPRARDLPADASAPAVRRGRALPALRLLDGRRRGRGCLRLLQPSGDERALVVVHSRYAEAEGSLRTSAPASRRSEGGRQLERQSLADALGLPRDDAAWVIFRDLVSGREGLRGCAGLHHDGLRSRCVRTNAACCSIGGSSSTATVPSASSRLASAGTGPCHRSMRPSRPSAPSGVRPANRPRRQTLLHLQTWHP